MVATLVQVTTPAMWAAYHRIRKAELWDARGRTTPLYNPNHPDETKPNHTPLLFLLNEVGVGTTRLDDLGNGRFCVRLVAIDKAFQGQGLGRTMLMQTLQRARDQGGTDMVVNADESAVGYYRACGFEEHSWNPEELKTPMGEGLTQMRRAL